MIAPLLGIALEDLEGELALGDGLSLVWADAMVDPPIEAVRGDVGQPHVLAKLTVTQDPMQPPPLSLARTRFRRLLTALRLFERGGYAARPAGLGPDRYRALAPRALRRGRAAAAAGGHHAEQEDELRAFCNLVEQRRPYEGELAWALARFEMGCERLVPFEALTDYLLGLRVLLEPEGPESGRLPAPLGRDLRPGGAARRRRLPPDPGDRNGAKHDPRRRPA